MRPQPTTARLAWLLPGACLAMLVAMLACGSSAAPRPDGGDADGGQPDVATDAEKNPDANPDANPTHGYTLPDIPGGESFPIILPPKFARFLPLSGDEVTREPPGFHEPTSPYYFSYGFIWWLTNSPPVDTASLRSYLGEYYSGLCAAPSPAVVTLDEPAADANVDAGMLAARRNGTLTAGSCFDLAVPAAALETSTYDCPDHTAVVVLLSPQPQSHEVWTELRALRDGFNCW